MAELHRAQLLFLDGFIDPSPADANIPAHFLDRVGQPGRIRGLRRSWHFLKPILRRLLSQWQSGRLKHQLLKEIDCHSEVTEQFFDAPVDTLHVRSLKHFTSAIATSI